MKKRTLLTFGVILSLAACTPTTPETGDDANLPPTLEPDIQVDDTPVRETHNVTYRGTVNPAGISIYMQGSHRLTLSDGRFILLESDGVDLNGYVGEPVEVTGALRPTVEAGGMIMRVDSITLDKEVAEEEPEEELEETEEEEEREEDTMEGEESMDEEEDAMEEENTNEPDDSSDQSDIEETEEKPEMTAALQARIDQMASEQSFSADQWTQQYCTGHIGFCIPVHKNWWFRSFGTTTSMLWHIEFSTGEILNLYDGPIHINLVNGSVASAQASDKEVKTQDGMTIGYRTWTGDRHFEITGDSSLEAAIRYITESFVEYTE